MTTREIARNRGPLVFNLELATAIESACADSDKAEEAEFEAEGGSTGGGKEDEGNEPLTPTHCPMLTSLNLNGNHQWDITGRLTCALSMSLVRVRPRLHWLGAIPTVNRLFPNRVETKGVADGELEKTLKGGA